jgi:hypothetical protein
MVDIVCLWPTAVPIVRASEVSARTVAHTRAWSPVQGVRIPSCRSIASARPPPRTSLTFLAFLAVLGVSDTVLQNGLARFLANPLDVAAGPAVWRVGAANTC